MPSAHECLFDRSQLHSGAAEAIDGDGVALLSAAQRGTIASEPPAFPSRRVPKATITEADLGDEPLMAWSDISGRTVGRYFATDGTLIALRDGGYRDLRRLVEKVVRARPFKAGLSEEFIEIEVFKWWRQTLREGVDKPLHLHLLDAGEKAVQRQRIMVPLSNLEIEGAFTLGDVLVTPFDPSLFDAFEAEGVSRFPDHADIFRAETDRMRGELGHLTFVQVEVVGELAFAQEKARQTAFEMADVIRFMSPAAPSWNIRFSCFPFGCEHEPQTTVMQLNSGKLGLIATGMRGVPSFRWKLSLADLDDCMTKEGFQDCAAFFAGRPLSPFEQRVKTAISAFSQGVAATDIRDRLIYATSAAEHLLLRDSNEPLQANVAERMAFLITQGVEKRRAIVANYKKAYALRSGQIHHLAAIDDEETLSTFFMNLYLTFVTAMRNMKRFKEHIDFIEAIDRIKFS